MNIKGDKMNSKSKIRIEITPEDGVDINKLRSDIHSILNSNRKECKSLRSWVELIKDDKKE